MDNANKTIYLHIGMPKSGTTSIQSFLYDNAEVLSEKADVFYPLLNSSVQNSIDKKINYRTIMIDEYYMHNGDINCYNRFFEDNFLKKIQENKCSKIVFSEEFIFMYCRDTKIIDIFLKHGFKVKVVVYLRKPSEYVASLWQENLKPYMDSFYYSIEDFAKISPVNYELISKFIEKIGKENVIIRPFEKQQWKNENLIEDFLEILDVKNFEKVNSSIKNSSYNRNLAEFMLILKGIDLPKNDLIKLLKNYLKKVLPSEKLPDLDNMNDYDLTEFIAENSPNTPKIIDTIPDEFIKEVHEQYASEINKIAKIYNKDSFFICDYPECYGTKRDKYDKITLTYEQLNLLHEAMSMKF